MEHLAYDEIIEFIASGATPQQVIDFRPSARVLKRVRGLLIASNAGELTQEGRDELSKYLTMEHMMRMAKLRARKNIAR
ncbi:MAG: hypothetical protein NWR72_12220 [Bacteroidia bacterium]|nr:hypothetical protein [Bacteroidia bacterium]